MATLILPWYTPRDPRHHHELIAALMHSVQAPGISRIIAVHEGAPPPLAHPKLELVASEHRPTIWEMIELVRDEGPFAIMNADCALIDGRFLNELGPRDALWVTRWEIRYGAPEARRYFLCGGVGADLFAWGSTPDEMARGDWAPGQSCVDWALSVEMHRAGYNVRNLPSAVPLIHMHAVRSAQEEGERPFVSGYDYYPIPAEDEPRSPIWRHHIQRGAHVLA